MTLSIRTVDQLAEAGLYRLHQKLPQVISCNYLEKYFFISDIAEVGIFPQTNNCIFVESYNLSHKNPRTHSLHLVDHPCVISGVNEGVVLVKKSC